MPNRTQVYKAEIGNEKVLAMLQLRRAIKESRFMKVTRLLDIIIKPAEELQILILSSTFS